MAVYGYVAVYIENSFMLMGFCEWRRWVGAPAQVYASAAHTANSGGPWYFSVPVYLGAVGVRHTQGGHSILGLGSGGLW